MDIPENCSSCLPGVNIKKEGLFMNIKVLGGKDEIGGNFVLLEGKRGK